jgi:hypothetical protein
MAAMPPMVSLGEPGTTFLPTPTEGLLYSAGLVVVRSGQRQQWPRVARPQTGHGVGVQVAPLNLLIGSSKERNDEISAYWAARVDLQNMETTFVAEDKARVWMEPFQLVVFPLFTRVSDSAHGLG